MINILFLIFFRFHDELVWAALWLYEATGSTRYFAAAEGFYSQYKLDSAQGELSWDSKTVATQLLLAKYKHRSGHVTEAKQYLTRVTEFCNHNKRGVFYFTLKIGFC